MSVRTYECIFILGRAMLLSKQYGIHVQVHLNKLESRGKIYLFQ